MRKLRPWEVNEPAQDPEEAVFTSKLSQLLGYSLPVFYTLLNGCTTSAIPDLSKEFYLLISHFSRDHWKQKLFKKKYLALK